MNAPKRDCVSLSKLEALLASHNDQITVAAISALPMLIRVARAAQWVSENDRSSAAADTLATALQEIEP